MTRPSLLEAQTWGMLRLGASLKTLRRRIRELTRQEYGTKNQCIRHLQRAEEGYAKKKQHDAKMVAGN